MQGTNLSETAPGNKTSLRALIILLTLPGNFMYNESWCSSYTLKQILFYSLCTVVKPAFTLFTATYTHEIRAAGMFSRELEPSHNFGNA